MYLKLPRVESVNSINTSDSRQMFSGPPNPQPVENEGQRVQLRSY